MDIHSLNTLTERFGYFSQVYTLSWRQASVYQTGTYDIELSLLSLCCCFSLQMLSNTRTQATACVLAIALNQCLSGTLLSAAEDDNIHKGRSYCRAVVFDCIRL